MPSKEDQVRDTEYLNKLGYEKAVESESEAGFVANTESVLSYQNKASVFSELWNWVESSIYHINVLKGWTALKRRDGETIALIHSEVSEALEALREGNPPSKVIEGVSQAEEELADTVIRIMDIAYTHKWNLPKAIFLKIEYNKTRPYRHGGKVI